VPQRDFVIWLDEQTYIAIDFATVQGVVVSFVVRLMIDTPGGEFNVARYDTAHGTPHLDIISPKNKVLSKEWLTNLDFQAALQYGIEDFKTNYEKYITQWRSENTKANAEVADQPSQSRQPPSERKGSRKNAP
jgi:hypothetical protein